MMSKTGNGFILLRTVSLAPDRPVVTVTTKVANPGSKPRVVQLRSHLALDLGDVHEARLAFTDVAGQKVEDLEG